VPAAKVTPLSVTAAAFTLMAETSVPAVATSVSPAMFTGWPSDGCRAGAGDGRRPERANDDISTKRHGPFVKAEE